jgi:hypothetical protein
MPDTLGADRRVVLRGELEDGVNFPRTERRGSPVPPRPCSPKGRRAVGRRSAGGRRHTEPIVLPPELVLVRHAELVVPSSCRRSLARGRAGAPPPLLLRAGRPGRGTPPEEQAAAAAGDLQMLADAGSATRSHRPLQSRLAVAPVTVRRGSREKGRAGGAEAGLVGERGW